MNISGSQLEDEGLANLAIDPDVLARELAAELLGDPLDEIQVDGTNLDDSNVAQECESGLAWLRQGQEERLQGLRVFCEHRDPRALPLLIPLLREPCPVIRMSAVYALGRNPCPRAVDILLELLQKDCNAYVRKATAWSLGNYADSPVLEPLVNALKNDVAAVRLWAAGSLAEAGATSTDKAEFASKYLLTSLQIDLEPIVRSNCIWSLGRLYDTVKSGTRFEIEDAFFTVLLNDLEPSVKYEARIALEQLDNDHVRKRIQVLMDEGCWC